MEKQADKYLHALKLATLSAITPAELWARPAHMTPDPFATPSVAALLPPALVELHRNALGKVFQKVRKRPPVHGAPTGGAKRARATAAAADSGESDGSDDESDDGGFDATAALVGAVARKGTAADSDEDSDDSDDDDDGSDVDSDEEQARRQKERRTAAAAAASKAGGGTSGGGLGSVADLFASNAGPSFVANDDGQVECGAYDAQKAAANMAKQAAADKARPSPSRPAHPAPLLTVGCAIASAAGCGGDPHAARRAQTRLVQGCIIAARPCFPQQHQCARRRQRQQL